MKKLVYLIVILFVFASLSSCGSKKKGCGLTSNVSATQEVIVVDSVK